MVLFLVIAVSVSLFALSLLLCAAVSHTEDLALIRARMDAMSRDITKIERGRP